MGVGVVVGVVVVDRAGNITDPEVYPVALAVNVPDTVGNAIGTFWDPVTVTVLEIPAPVSDTSTAVVSSEPAAFRVLT